MLYCIIRSKQDDEPIALVRMNTKALGDYKINNPLRDKYLGYYAPIVKCIEGSHPYYTSIIAVYNIVLGYDGDLIRKFKSDNGVQLEVITQSEWESWDAMELFPRLKTSVAA